MPCSDLPTESCMSRASRARSSAAPTAATAAATSSRASTALATAAAHQHADDHEADHQRGRTGEQGQPSGPGLRQGAEQDARCSERSQRQGGGQHDQEPAGEEQTGQQGGADHRERRRLRRAHADQQAEGERDVHHGEQRVPDQHADLPVAQAEHQTGQGEQEQTEDRRGRRIRTGQDGRGGQQQAEQPGMEDPPDEPEIAGVVQQRAGPGRCRVRGAHGSVPPSSRQWSLRLTAGTPSSRRSRCPSRGPAPR